MSFKCISYFILVAAVSSLWSSLHCSYCSGGHFGRDLRSSQADNWGTVWAIHMGTVQGETMNTFGSLSSPFLCLVYLLIVFLVISAGFLQLTEFTQQINSLIQHTSVSVQSYTFTSYFLFLSSYFKRRWSVLLRYLLLPCLQKAKLCQTSICLPGVWKQHSSLMFKGGYFKDKDGDLDFLTSLFLFYPFYCFFFVCKW